MQNKGISLIVLVITIIVMIILAAAVIISLNNTGIIGNANKAKDMTNESQIKEMAQIAWLEGKHEGKTGEELNTYVQESLKKSIPENNLKDYIVVVKDTKIAILPSAWKDTISDMQDNVPIPKGFVASNATGENKKSTGLVIYEGEEEVTDVNVEEARRTRNQYVWVPVEDMSNFIRQDFGKNDAKKLDNSTTINIETSWEISPNMEYNENAMTQEELSEVKNMYASVEKYKGFYVARYQAGIDVPRASDTLKGKNVSSKMNKYVYRYPRKSTAKEIARSIYPTTDNTTGVVSTLMYSVQWDTTVKWLLDTGAIANVTDSTAYGNYVNHEIKKGDVNKGAKYAIYKDSWTISDFMDAEDATKSSGEAWLLTAGALKTSTTNNIYDMAGNLWEQTMEYCYTRTLTSLVYFSTFRSGSCFKNGSNSIAHRWLGSNDFSDVATFRTSLYIKL